MDCLHLHLLHCYKCLKPLTSQTRVSLCCSEWNFMHTHSNAHTRGAIQPSLAMQLTVFHTFIHSHNTYNRMHPPVCPTPPPLSPPPPPLCLQFLTFWHTLHSYNISNTKMISSISTAGQINSRTQSVWGYKKGTQDFRCGVVGRGHWWQCWRLNFEHNRR